LKKGGAGGVAQEEEFPPSKRKALSSNPNTNKREKEGRKEGRKGETGGENGNIMEVNLFKAQCTRVWISHHEIPS
jgi:hypothetical protein